LPPASPGTLDSSEPAALEFVPPAGLLGSILSEPLTPEPAPSEAEPAAGPFLLPVSPLRPGFDAPPVPG
jgi:hypothetical protein